MVISMALSISVVSLVTHTFLSATFNIRLTYVVSLPELVAQTNMDQQSVKRLKEELTRLTNWLGRNTTKYFVSEYETTGPEYIEKARGV